MTGTKHHHHDLPAHFTDPVCGMSTDRENEFTRYDHDGKPYYFCGEHCLTKLKSNLKPFDGINDAPALAQAQVVIAMESAGFTLVKGDLAVSSGPGSLPAPPSTTHCACRWLPEYSIHSWVFFWHPLSQRRP